MERKYTLKEKIIMYFAMWVYLVIFALKDFLWCLNNLILSFLPFMWKVEVMQTKRLPILRDVIYILDYFLWNLRDKMGRRNKMKNGKDKNDKGEIKKKDEEKELDRERV